MVAVAKKTREHVSVGSGKQLIKQSKTNAIVAAEKNVIYDLLLNRRTATWNLFVLYNKELKYTEKSFNDDVIYTSVLQ